jgi:ComF family protein
VWDYPFERIFSLFDFDDTVQQLAHEFKYRGKRDLAYFCGHFFGAYVEQSVYENADYIMAVPLHRRRQRRRGYNQADYLARGFADCFGRCHYIRHGMYRVRATVTQTHLDEHERMENVRGAFAVHEEIGVALKGKVVVLVDDVITTGATTAQCAEVLKEAGCRSVRVLSLARA